MLKVVAYFLLFMTLNVQTSLGQVMNGCPQRTCNGITGAPAAPSSPQPPFLPPPPPPSLPSLPQEEGT